MTDYPPPENLHPRVIAQNNSKPPSNYSDGIIDSPYGSQTPFLSPQNDLKGPQMTSQSVPLDHLQPYRDYVEDPLPSKEGRWNRVGTSRTNRSSTNSLFGRASTAWSSTKQFAVSHFNVPKAAAPWEHQLAHKEVQNHPQPSKTVRRYNPRVQRWRLFLNTLTGVLMTLFLCAAISGTYYGFSTVRTGLDSTMKRVFNALNIGLSLLLGMNIAASLKNYAQLIRWRFLAQEYRTLQDFELIMSCESLSKVFRLIWAGRTRGSRLPNKVQIFAFLYFLINLGLQVGVALLGLTTSLDISQEFTTLTQGNTSIADLSSIQSGGQSPGINSTLEQEGVARDYGIVGQDFSIYTQPTWYVSGNEQAVYAEEGLDLFYYRFVDRNPDNLDLNVVTERVVTSQANCKSYEVIQGGRAGYDVPDNNTDQTIRNLVVFIDEYGQNQTIYVQNQATGATVWMGDRVDTCGKRCTKLYALQVGYEDPTPAPRFWECNNTVSEVSNMTDYFDDKAYILPDDQARIVAGSIGWSGINTTGFNIEWVNYENGNQFAPDTDATPEQMAQALMKYTAGTLAGMDTTGFRANVTGFFPTQAQVLNIDWFFAPLILGIVAGVQILLFLCVIALANKVIIKDTSPLSMARLLRPIADKLGDRGCLLTGEEIAEELGNYKVIYGFREPNSDPLVYSNTMPDDAGIGDGQHIRHLDIIEETEKIPQYYGHHPPGLYDGLYGHKCGDRFEEERFKQA